MAKPFVTRALGRVVTAVFLIWLVPQVFFVPYYNWEYARENGFVKWLLLGEIVPTFKALGWPYFIFSARSGGHAASLQHLARSIEYKNESTRMVNKSLASEQIEPSDTAYILSTMRKALEEARLVDTRALNETHPGFAAHFRREYVKGLEAYIEGCEQSHDDKRLEGMILLDAWGDWYTSRMLRLGARRAVAARDTVAESSLSAKPPPFNASEFDRYSKVLVKVDKQLWSDSDLAELRAVIAQYTRRTGSRVSAENCAASVLLLVVVCDYEHEWATSALLSWDGQEYFMTGEFERLRKMAVPLLRPKELFEQDLQMLTVASRRQQYAEDAEGRRIKFGREIILRRMREAEIMRANIGKLARITKEFARQAAGSG
jgi:hypothetical protein